MPMVARSAAEHLNPHRRSVGQPVSTTTGVEAANDIARAKPTAALPVDPVMPPTSTADEPIAPVHSHTAALVLLVLLALVWGVHWAVVKIGLDYIPPLTYAALRVFTGLVTVVVILVWKGRLRLPERTNASIVFSVGLGQVAAGVVLMTLALRVVPAGRSSVLVYSMPIWVAVLLAVFFGIRPRRNELVGLILGIGGLIVLFNPAVVDWGSSGELVGAFELLLNAILWAAVTIHVRRHRWTQSPLDLQPWQLLVALVPIAIVALIVEQGQGIVWGPVMVLVLLYSGPLATAFATWASQSVTRALGPQASAIGFLAVPVVGLLSGWLILGERLGALDLLGFGLVLGGVGITQTAPKVGDSLATGL
jgi:drug/metabolite transporter (DMT)-like permease